MENDKFKCLYNEKASITEFNALNQFWTIDVAESKGPSDPQLSRIDCVTL